ARPASWSLGSRHPPDGPPLAARDQWRGCCVPTARGVEVPRRPRLPLTDTRPTRDSRADRVGVAKAEAFRQPQQLPDASASRTAAPAGDAQRMTLPLTSRTWAAARPLPIVVKSVNFQTTFSRVTSNSWGLPLPAWQLPTMTLPLGST